MDLVNNIRAKKVITRFALQLFRHELQESWDELKQSSLINQMDATNFFMFLNNFLTKSKFALVARRIHNGEPSKEDLKFEITPNHSIMLNVPEHRFLMSDSIETYFNDSSSLKIERVMNGRQLFVESTTMRTIHPYYITDASIHPSESLHFDNTIKVQTVAVSLLRYSYNDEKKLKTFARVPLSTQFSVSNIPVNGNLQAVVVHLGDDIDTGHYVTYIRESSNDWILFNDDEVSYEQYDEVESVISRNGCLFFYRI